jgi:cytochrome oxidase Cu insertion factor (SCO1/SenC/PrrC family)
MSDQADAAGASEEQGPSRLTGGVLWGSFALLLAVIIAGGVLALRQGGLSGLDTGEMLRPLAAVPDFVLRERSGQPVSKADLLGKVWIVNFIFTQCVEECPLAISLMARLQEAFTTEADVRLVSITVDPEHDTPEVLREYAESVGAHPQRWLFLTGEKERIYRLAREGFRLGVLEVSEAGQSATMPPWPGVWKAACNVFRVLTPAVALAHHDSLQGTKKAIQHSARFVLVDRQGQIRQYYKSEDDDALRRLQHHVKLLLQER